MPTPTAAIVQPKQAPTHQLIAERYTLSPQLPLTTYQDSFGNTVWRWLGPEGQLRIRYDAIAEVPPTPDPVLPDLPGTTVDQLPNEVLIYTLPSRYCPSDMIVSEAWQLFSETPDGWARVKLSATGRIRISCMATVIVPRQPRAMMPTAIGGVFVAILPILR